MDRITKEHRSWNMSRIRGMNTRPEILVRKFLYSNGVRYRVHAKLPGKPDIVIRKKNLAIFINGCFWHAHNGCKDFRLPKARSNFWKAKIEGNIARDQKNYALLKEGGWHVMIAWECDIKRNEYDTLNRILSVANNDLPVIDS